MAELSLLLLGLDVAGSVLDRIPSSRRLMNIESSAFEQMFDQVHDVWLVIPVDLSALGVTAAFGGLGLVHQSNGQTPALSRSWNRLYVQLGAAKGNFTVIARTWTRIGDINDNPDIFAYMGYGDLTGTYRWHGHEFSGLVRQNFATRRGAVQASWAFPVVTNLKGYVQLFSGYGQSLIDYNASQTTIGLGALVGF